MKRIVAYLLSILLLTILSACRIPGQVTPQTEVLDPNAIYTAAAETIAARLAQTDAAASPVGQDSGESGQGIPSDTPVPPEQQQPSPTPSETPQPTATNTPEDTLTLTPTPTETTSPTPTTNPEAIYTDDFSNASGWYVYDDDDWELYFEDESYHIFNNLLGAAIFSYRFQDYARVGLEVDGTRTDGPSDGYYGVVCRLSDEGKNYYALVVGDDGFFGIALMEDNEFDFLVDGVDDKGIINKGKGSINRVRGDCIDDHLVLYANGKQLIETWDDTLTKGKAGLVAGNKFSGVGIDVSFDNFAIYKP